MILKINGEKIQCDRAERGDDYIKVYQNGAIIREDGGISDFSGYSLTDDSGSLIKFDTSELSLSIEERQETLEKAFLEMAGELYG